MTSYIYMSPGWPNFFWDNEMVASPLGATRHHQGRHLGRMEALGFELRDEAQLHAMALEVVKSSAIEGESLPPAEVRSSIARRLGLDVGGLPNPSRHVDGTVEMMLDATQGFDRPLTRERLFGWHAALFPTGRSGIQPIVVGGWRTGKRGPMQVVSGPIGKETVHFVAPPAMSVDAEMDCFLTAFNQPSDVDPVLQAAVAHLWFVTIHPFEDGNGRIARAISDMCLARADGTKHRYYSMSAGIEERRDDYYTALESAQKRSLDITAWLLWFLECLDRTIDNANTSLGFVFRKARVWDQAKGHPINDRQKKIINRMLDDFKGFLTTSKYGKIAKCSNDTALRDIRELLEIGILRKNEGGGRSTSYRLADEEGSAEEPQL